MAIVCIVLGLWGIWDYTVAIPQDEAESNVAALMRLGKDGLDSLPGSEKRDEAIVAFGAAIDNNVFEDGWINSLVVVLDGLKNGGVELQLESMEVVDDYLTRYGRVIAPSKYDRPIQWMFILCLPFGFYYLWKYSVMKKKAKSYSLDDDGKLTTPEGSWDSEEINDIDMSRWIAKTGNARTTWTAKVITGDGKRILLDDYIYQDMHLIIGKIAHRFYPDQWTPLARGVVESDQEESPLDE
jgi:hypothetical protein